MNGSGESKVLPTTLIHHRQHNKNKKVNIGKVYPKVLLFVNDKIVHLENSESMEKSLHLINGSMCA